MSIDWTAVKKVYKGTVPVKKVYRGSTLLWEKEAEPGPEPEPAGATLLYLTLTSELTQTLCVTLAADSSAVVDWGDGTSDTLINSGTSAGTPTKAHTWASAGDYVVTVTGPIYVLGNVLGTTNLLNRSAISGKAATSPECTAVHIGSNVENIATSCFDQFTSLAYISIPATVALVYAGAFSRCTALTRVEAAAEELSTSVFGSDCIAFQKVWLRSTITTVQANVDDSGNHSSPFIGCPASLVLYCEPTSRPTGWNEHFDEYDAAGSKLTVVWGQTTSPF